MVYDKIKNKTEQEYRDIFESEYCDWQNNPVITFDGISVKFFPNQFDHAFTESDDWRSGDKSIFSYNRAERISWIRDALEDSTADLRIGWDKHTKSYDNTLRVAIVKKCYVVIIKIQNRTTAKFRTAFEAYNTIDKNIN